MPDTLAEILARLKADVPALADVPDDVLAAELQRQGALSAGPAVADALGVPVFRTSNEKDPSGAAVVREPVSAWTKAATIGAPGIGEHYTFPSVGEVLASDAPLQLLAQFVTGHGRPRSVANADPLGITAFHEGKAPPPLFMGSTEEVGAAVGDVLGAGEGRGLYSRVDDAVSRLPAKGAHPNKIASLLKSSGATAEELAYRQVPEFLAAQGNAPVTPAALQAHLDAHPAALPVVKTLGGPASARPMPEGYRIEPLAPGNRPGAQYNYALVGPDGTGRAFYATDAADAQFMANDMLGLNIKAPTHYAQYQLPGGEAYQETLLTLPGKTDPAAMEARIKELDRVISYGPDMDRASWNEVYAEREALQHNLRSGAGQYRGDHFGDEPNILVHTRSNTRTLPTGEPGRFVEEVQSDWHQVGKEQGYSPAPGSADAERLAAEDSAATRAHSATVRELEAAHDRVKYGTDESGALSEQLYYSKQQLRQLAETPGKPGTPERAAYLQAAAEVDRLSEALQAMQQQHLTAHEAASAANDAAYARVLDLRTKLRGGVPDAPFKETWQALALKQQLLDVAKDPHAQWLGVSSADTQINRWGSQRLRWQPSPAEPGKWYVTYEPQVGGDALAGQGIADMGAEAEARGHIETTRAPVRSEADLAAVMGDPQKAAKAWKRLQAAPAGGEYLPRATGFRQQYDENLPDTLGKLVKPFGGTVERTAIGTARKIFERADGWYAEIAHEAPDGPFPTREAAANHWPADQTPAWIVRLTPAMKARLLKEGLPLSLLLGAAGPSVADALGGDSNTPQ